MKRLWRYKQQNGTHPHKVFGPPHADGSDYAPLCEFSDAGDAILAAAAPDLLDAAKQAVHLFPDLFRGSVLETAIAKAESK